MSVKTSLVCNQWSRRYPKKPPTTVAPTSTKGNSIARPNCVLKFPGLRPAGDGELILLGLLSKGVARDAQE